MKAFKVYKARYNKLIPKLTYIYSGYKGLARGIGLLWNNRLIPIILPINER